MSSNSYEVSEADVGSFFSCALCVNMEKTRSMRREKEREIGTVSHKMSESNMRANGRRRRQCSELKRNITLLINDAHE